MRGLQHSVPWKCEHVSIVEPRCHKETGGPWRYTHDGNVDIPSKWLKKTIFLGSDPVDMDTILYSSTQLRNFHAYHSIQLQKLSFVTRHWTKSGKIRTISSYDLMQLDLIFTNWQEFTSFAQSEQIKRIWKSVHPIQGDCAFKNWYVVTTNNT